MNSTPFVPAYAGHTDRVRWLFCALGCALAIALFNHSLVPSMEPRFAEAIREMLVAGEWLIPIKNGRPYVEYPPLYYWLGLGLKTAGLPLEAAIRVPAYLSFLLWIWLLHRWQALAAPQWPVYAYGLAGAAMPLAMFQFYIAQTDGLLVLGVMLAMYGYARHRAGWFGRAFPWALWSGVVLATSAKGPVGLACTLPVFVLDVTLSTWQSWRTAAGPGHFWQNLKAGLLPLCWMRGGLLVLFTVVPWYVLAGASRGWDFVYAVLIHQNIDRYLTGYSHWQPWWYYLKTIVYDFFPASLLLPAGLYAASRRLTGRHERLAAIWAVFTFLFFSFSGSKQGKYLLPATPAFIALSFMGIDVIRSWTKRDVWPAVRGWYRGLLGVWIVLIVAMVPFFSGQIGGRDGYVPIREQLSEERGQLVHFQWPRSMTLYELGAPMPFVRSARELYRKIHEREIAEGSYILVRQNQLGERAGANPARQLSPYPNAAYFDEVLVTQLAKAVVLLRVRRGAASAPLPATPEPEPVAWRERLFDTD